MPMMFSDRAFAHGLKALRGLSLALALALCAGLWPVADAQAQNELASPWVEGPLSRARLVGGRLEGKSWQAGVEISLKGEAHTYWRFPGDSGVPPAFDFAGSQNMASATPRYPAPERIEEAGLQTFGYKGEVIFPITVVAVDADKPLILTLHFTYAACEKICMPTEARLRIELDPRLQNQTLSKRIADYEALAPRPLSTPGAPRLTIVKGEARAGKPVWIVSADPAPGAAADLIADGPEGWFYDSKKRPNGTFEVILAERPPETRLSPQATLTLLAEKGAFETTLDLDAAALKP